MAHQRASTDVRLVDGVSNALRAGDVVALVTIIDTVGSAPRPVGTKMMVRADGTWEGSVGGGAMEALVIRQARIAMAEHRSRRAKFSLDATGPRSIGMYCGGEVEVFIDVLFQPLRVVLVGEGPVVDSVASLAAVLGLRVLLVNVDDRSAVSVSTSPLLDELSRARIDGASYVVVATQSVDAGVACLEVLLKSGAAYIGLVGDVPWTRTVMGRLHERGIDAGADRRLFGPGGLSLGSAMPGAVAVSVLSEVLKIHNGATGSSLRTFSPLPTR